MHLSSARELFRTTREILRTAQSVGCDVDGCHHEDVTDDISSGAVAATLGTSQVTSAEVQWPPSSGRHRWHQQRCSGRHPQDVTDGISGEAEAQLVKQQDEYLNKNLSNNKTKQLPPSFPKKLVWAQDAALWVECWLSTPKAWFWARLCRTGTGVPSIISAFWRRRQKGQKFRVILGHMRLCQKRKGEDCIVPAFKAGSQQRCIKRSLTRSCVLETHVVSGPSVGGYLFIH